MSDVTTTTWDCDRCGARVVLDHTAVAWPQPADWSTVYAVSPPRKNPADDRDAKLGTLCTRCTAALAAFMRPTLTP